MTYFIIVPLLLAGCVLLSIGTTYLYKRFHGFPFWLTGFAFFLVSLLLPHVFFWTLGVNALLFTIAQFLCFISYPILIKDKKRVHDVMAIVLCSALFFSANMPHVIYTDYQSNIIKAETPIVEEVKYDIVDVKSTDIVSGTVGGFLTIIDGNLNEEYCYRVYCNSEPKKGKSEIVLFTLAADEVKLYLLPESENIAYDEYLLEITTTNYSNDKNKNPAEMVVDSVEVSYELYVKESTIQNLN